jgi:hypothetical protein
MRLRFIKKIGCTCPCQPYLKVDLVPFWPFIYCHWNCICMCKINAILKQ